MASVRGMALNHELRVYREGGGVNIAHSYQVQTWMVKSERSQPVTAPLTAGSCRRALLNFKNQK